MILTYLVEFDKVHYPLPLLFNDKPNVDSLQGTITRLRDEINILRSTDSAQSLNQRNTNQGTFLTGVASDRNRKENMTQSDGMTKELMMLTQENSSLKTRIKKLEDNFKFKKGAVELELLLKDKIEMENENRISQQETMSKISYLEQSLDEKEDELN